MWPFSIPKHDPVHYYEEYERLTKVDLDQVEIFRLLKAWCHGRKRILELGCGVGYFSHHLGAVGVDVNEEAVRRAKKNYPDGEFHCFDIQKVGFPDHTFDAIVCNNIIEHLPDPVRANAYKELTRLVAPGGVLLFGYSDPYHVLELMSALSKGDKGLWDPTHIHNWSVRGFVAEIGGAFRVEEWKRVSIFAKFLPWSQMFKAAVAVKAGVK